MWFIRDTLVDALRVVSPRYRMACKFHSAESILLTVYTIPAILRILCIHYDSLAVQ